LNTQADSLIAPYVCKKNYSVEELSCILNSSDKMKVEIILHHAFRSIISDREKLHLVLDSKIHSKNFINDLFLPELAGRNRSFI
jgi:hypothetical protein